MANSKQARKRSRQARAHNEHNTALRTRLRTAIKKVRKAIAVGDKAAIALLSWIVGLWAVRSTAQLRASTSVIDSIADKKLVHKNLAARNKSRLSAAIKAMA
jgi:small subunit ribosomal protein S20